MNRSQHKLQLVPNREINFSNGLFARHLSPGDTTWHSLITQIIPFRHSEGAHHLVTCASARSVLSERINICHVWDFYSFLPDSPSEKTACGCCFSLRFRLGFLPAKSGQSCAPLCLEGRRERLVMISWFLQEFTYTETRVKEHK